jgi:alpha/beta hydrolase family protein
VLESLDVRDVRAFGDRPYEWVSAVAAFAVDPGAPGNDRIADLGLAPRGPDGRVRFTADVRLLRPTGGGCGRALVVVPNRGRIGPVPFSLDAPLPAGALDVPAAGDGFLLDRGWTIAWCGWQWDLPREEGLGLDAPRADVGPGWLRVEFRPDRLEPDHALSDSGPLFRYTDYPTADVDDPDATLTVRTTPMGPDRTVPRSRWRFTGPTRFAVDGGFRPFHWYRLTYRSTSAPVVGTGLLAMRDIGAHLRAGHAHVFAYGVSQSGRFLRQFLHEGLNLDEGGGQVFDGVFAHIASARRGEFNARFGQPALTHPLTPAYGPPHDTTALLRRQRSLGGVPKLVLTNSAFEYWRGDGALVHQDARTGDDLPEDPDARAHLIAGTDHLGGLLAMKRLAPVANPVHGLDPSPVLRALLVQLVEWVCDGVEPAPSRVPRRADGTAVTREEVLAAFPGAARPDVEHLPWTPVIDPDRRALPLEPGEPLVALVSAVDAGGNEVAGIRLPAVAAGTAAHTGWNPRVHVDGLPEVLYEMVGSRLPRPGAAPARAAIEAAADALVADRFLRPADRERAVADAVREAGTAG